jgi:hypothetical protein
MEVQVATLRAHADAVEAAAAAAVRAERVAATAAGLTRCRDCLLQLEVGVRSCPRCGGLAAGAAEAAFRSSSALSASRSTSDASGAGDGETPPLYAAVGELPPYSGDGGGSGGGGGGGSGGGGGGGGKGDEKGVGGERSLSPSPTAASNGSTDPNDVHGDANRHGSDPTSVLAAHSDQLRLEISVWQKERELMPSTTEEEKALRRMLSQKIAKIEAVLRDRASHFVRLSFEIARRILFVFPLRLRVAFCSSFL